jgi:hypothetical protein
LAFYRSVDLARHLQEKRTGNPVNRWPTEETLLGAFFDVQNLKEVAGSRRQRRGSQRWHRHDAGRIGFAR